MVWTMIDGNHPLFEIEFIRNSVKKWIIRDNLQRYEKYASLLNDHKQQIKEAETKTVKRDVLDNLNEARLQAATVVNIR